MSYDQHEPPKFASCRIVCVKLSIECVRACAGLAVNRFVYQYEQQHQQKTPESRSIDDDDDRSYDQAVRMARGLDQKRNNNIQRTGCSVSLDKEIILKCDEAQR